MEPDFSEAHSGRMKGNRKVGTWESLTEYKVCLVFGGGFCCLFGFVCLFLKYHYYFKTMRADALQQGPTEDVEEIPSLEMFRTWLNTALSNVL